MTEENSNNDIKVYIKKDELQYETLNSVEMDYTIHENGGDLLTILEDDGTRWATAFAQFYKKKYEIDINVEFAFVWFANAIENTWQLRKRKENEAETPNEGMPTTSE